MVTFQTANMLENFRQTILQYIDEHIPKTVHDDMKFSDFRATVSTYLKAIAELADQKTCDGSMLYVNMITLQNNVILAVSKYYNEIGITASEYEYESVWASCTHKMVNVKRMLEAYHGVLFLN